MKDTSNQLRWRCYPCFTALRIAAVAILLLVTTIPGSAVFAAQPAPTTNPSDFKLTAMMELPDLGPLSVEVLFVGKHVLTFAGTSEEDLDAIFDLRGQTWYDVETAERMTLPKAQAWAEGMSKGAKASLVKMPDGKHRTFVAALIDPKFEVSEKDGVLILKNAAMTYQISALEPLSDDLAGRFFAYDRLNAYHKAMKLRKMPPFPQLAVTTELQRRKMFPRQIDVTITSPNGEQLVATKMSIQPLSRQERTRAEQLLADHPDAEPPVTRPANAATP